MAWGAAIALAGASRTAWLVLLFLVLAGAADMISGIFRSVIWHQTIPDEMRGRLAGIELLSYSVGPLGGQARSGLVADLTSVRISIVSGGALCVAGVAATAAALRDFWAYDARTDEHAVRERSLRAARDSLVPRFVTMTSAPATTACVGSFTVPTTPPVKLDCASSGAAASMLASPTPANRLKTRHCMEPSSRPTPVHSSRAARIAWSRRIGSFGLCRQH